MLEIFNSLCSFVSIKNLNCFTIKNDIENNYQLSKFLEKSYFNYSSFVLLVGLDTRYENYILNLKFKQRALKGNFSIFSIGPKLNLTLPSKSLGSNLNVLTSIFQGNHNLCRAMSKSKKPLLITSSNNFQNKN